MEIDRSFWCDKRVVVTGHTGFKGAWLSIWLKSLGAEVYGFSLENVAKSDVFHHAGLEQQITGTFGDIRNIGAFKTFMKAARPDVLFHCAAQALVLDSYDNPASTFHTNVVGTANVLQTSIESEKRIAVVNVTSDKCYENNERGTPFTETDRLGGKDPYSASKACAELVAASYLNIINQNKDLADIGIASVRAGNVIGGGDSSPNRLLPDIFRAQSSGDRLFIRNPSAVRPWQHVLEPVSAYLQLAQALYESPRTFSEGWNVGPDADKNYPVSYIVNAVNERLPFSFEFGAESGTGGEATLLRLDSTKIRNALNWNSKLGIDDALKATIDWQEALGRNAQMLNITLEQINRFTA